jgi:hypothetical protein
VQDVLNSQPMKVSARVLELDYAHDKHNYTPSYLLYYGPFTKPIKFIYLYLSVGVNRGPHPIEEKEEEKKRILGDIILSSRQALQVKKFFYKLSSFLHLCLKSLKNKSLLDQV